MYACVVKNSEGTWDILNFATYGNEKDYPNLKSRQERLAKAMESGLPITSMVLTPYEHSGMPGAIFDGTKFTGGERSSVRPEADWTAINYYGYLCDNMVIYGVITVANSKQHLQCEAIFDGETTIVNIPDELNPKVGDTWDGENLIKK